MAEKSLRERKISAKEIKHSKGKLTARCNVGAGWQYATSDREDFTTRSTYSFRYELTLGAKELVWGINLSTDIYLLQRRGYDDDSMNDNSLVWDAPRAPQQVAVHIRPYGPRR